MFARPEVAVPVALLDANADAARQSPKLMATAFQRDVRFLRAEFLRIIAPPLSAHKRPTAFQSVKQQGWWFKNGIHQWRGRTGAQEKGWRTDTKTTEAGSIFRYWNTESSVVFTQGYRQQRMHFGAWKREEDAVREFQPIGEHRIRESWRTVSDPTAGVRR
jgi:hypothetical protein